MSIYLDPEIEEGNIEYKRCLINIDKERYEEFVSQMLWRIKEGNGEAIYYLGVEDNGSFYNWTNKQRNESIKNFNDIIKRANLKIAKMTKIKYNIDNKIDNYYLKIVIREKENKINEKRILLLGDTGVGKTTLIANLLHSKIDEVNKEARLYVLNHKHEMIQKKTSSFNYNSIIFDNIKWVFIEAPGDDKYIKTRNKLILTFGSSIDICYIINSNKSWKWKNVYIDYLEKAKIPYFDLDIHSSDNIFPNYNCKELINKKDFFKNTVSLCRGVKLSNELEFVSIDCFNNPHVGIVIIGVLKSGTIYENKNYYLHLKNEIKEVRVKSIHIDCKPVSIISGPKTVSICIEDLNELKSKDYTGILSNRILETIDLKEKISINKDTIIYKDNKMFTINNYKNYYQTNDKIFILERKPVEEICIMSYI